MKPDKIQLKNEIEALEYLQSISTPKGSIILFTETINEIVYINLKLSRLNFYVNENVETINDTQMIKYDLLMPVIDRMYETAILLPDNKRD